MRKIYIVPNLSLIHVNETGNLLAGSGGGTNAGTDIGDPATGTGEGAPDKTGSTGAIGGSGDVGAKRYDAWTAWDE